MTVHTIATAAGVGKQTIYRWWPSKGAVLLDALTERARHDVPTPDTGSVDGDLAAFLTATFRGGRRATMLLRKVMAESLRDPAAGEVLREFTAGRRQALRGLLVRGQERGELPPGTDLDLLVDQAYGTYWYRLLLGHAPIDDRAAAALARSLLAQARDDKTPGFLGRADMTKGPHRVWCGPFGRSGGITPVPV